MKISEAIAAIKHGCRGQMNGKPANDEKDRILFGQDHAEDELTGIVVCATATVDVIRRAVELGANLIMSNAGLFWNHGDRTDWLAGNEVFEAKRALLAQNGIVVWRNFEYVISGIPVEGGYIDGMAYGFAKTMGWDQYLDVANAIANPADFFFKYEFPEPVSVAELARQCRERAGLVGVTVVGNKDVKVRRLYYSRHQNLGIIDAKEIETITADDVDCLVSGDLVEYTVAAYVRDAVAAGHPKCILKFGNFNEADAGMAYCEAWVPQAIGHAAPVVHVPMGDVVAQYVR